MTLISSFEKYRDSLFSVAVVQAIDPSGFKVKRGIVQHRGSAVMMSVDDRRRILLVRQYRLPARQSLWELPAGSLDEGETPLRAAKRELKEETGYRAKTWKKLITFYPSPGFLTETMTIYLATDLREGAAAPMDDERIEARWFPASEVEKMVLEGRIVDAKTIIGYFIWKRQRKALA